VRGIDAGVHSIVNPHIQVPARPVAACVFGDAEDVDVLGGMDDERVIGTRALKPVKRQPDRPASG
jgi:hypothetical protein